MDETQVSVTRRYFLAAVSAAALAAYGCSSKAQSQSSPLVAQPPNPFDSGWQMQASSQTLAIPGDQISQATYDPKGWYNVAVPTTVLAGLVASGEYPDLFYSDNLTRVPKERFHGSWWYRKTFTVSASDAAAQAWLHFKGINYRANIWLNGKQIADSKTIVGAYAEFEMPISPVAGDNVLAVEIFPPVNADLSITFVDWAPHPPDSNMGIWQDVELRFSRPVAVRNPHILTDLNLQSMADAKLTIMADLVNPTNQPVTGMLSGQIEQIQFSQTVTLAANETKTVTFDPADFPQLTIKSPRVWWPWQLGNPDMYSLKLSFSVNGSESDLAAINFGIRKVTSRLLNGHTLFTVNGVDLLIMGGGYAPDLLQRRVMPDRPDWQEDHIRYVRDMNLNAVRLEGKLEDDAFFDICDRYGILVMAGWCCCSAWERWKNWKPEQHAVADASLRYQIRKLRTHPSMLVWLNGSDNHPTADVEAKYLAIEKELHWPNPTLASAAAATAASGPTGVKMEGPYKWEPPIYWLTDKHNGGAYGFNTEVGPGAVPPPIETIQKMLPPEHQWPIDEAWSFHCGAESFSKITDFTDAMDARFGKSTGLADFCWKSQAQGYETIRAMYEGFRRNKFNATGEIQWMLNNAWPSLIWHLYDYYFRAGAAYFATKLGCEPLHVLYSYDNHSIVIANDTLNALTGVQVTAEVYDIDSKLVHKQPAVCDAPANAPTVAFTLPDFPNISTAYFLRLTLNDSAGKLLSVNTYFLSTKPDVLGPNGGEDDWNVTHCVSFCDYTQLQNLPKVQLTATLDDFAAGLPGAAMGETQAQVTVTNTSPTIALMVRLKLTKRAKGEEILPVRWQDNYFTLLANETRTVTVKVMQSDMENQPPALEVDCFNNGRA